MEPSLSFHNSKRSTITIVVANQPVSQSMTTVFAYLPFNNTSGGSGLAHRSVQKGLSLNGISFASVRPHLPH